MEIKLRILKNTEYRIKGKSQYFKNKYGHSNPIICIEDTDKNVFGQSWEWMKGNPACMLFGIRTGSEGLETTGKVYYGKVLSMGELVWEYELENLNAVFQKKT